MSQIESMKSALVVKILGLTWDCHNGIITNREFRGLTSALVNQLTKLTILTRSTGLAD